MYSNPPKRIRLRCWIFISRWFPISVLSFTVHLYTLPIEIHRVVATVGYCDPISTIKFVWRGKHLIRAFIGSWKLSLACFRMYLDYKVQYISTTPKKIHASFTVIDNSCYCTDFPFMIAAPSLDTPMSLCFQLFSHRALKSLTTRL